MNKLAIRKPITALRQLVNLALPDAMDGDVIELTILVDNHDLVIRDMVAYFELIDHIYGRLQPEGFRSYALQHEHFLRFDEIRQGSLLMLILDKLNGFPLLVVLWLCLKYLPSGANFLASAYNHYQQAALASEKRKRIRRKMECDKELTQLPKKLRTQLAAFVEFNLRKDSELLNRAIRFAERHVTEIKIRIKK